MYFSVCVNFSGYKGGKINRKTANSDKKVTNLGETNGEKRVQPISEMTLNVSQIWINLMKKNYI